ncbi:hypothetical protein [Candidatus Binatus sp.]|uniref:hypothetical protein n=1 Tax=Candidatus Binatus sp. TaxID=2811406 RepID=UPI003C967F1C
MNNSTKHDNANASRSIFRRFARIATALAFGGLLLCALPANSALAARHGGGHGGYHGAYHGGHGGWHGGWHGGGWGGYYGGPEYYPYGPDPYVEPEPYAYYPPGEYGPDYYPPSEGMNLFFHL